MCPFERKPVWFAFPSEQHPCLDAVCAPKHIPRVSEGYVRTEHFAKSAVPAAVCRLVGFREAARKPLPAFQEVLALRSSPGRMRRPPPTAFRKHSSTKSITCVPGHAAGMLVASKRGHKSMRPKCGKARWSSSGRKSAQGVDSTCWENGMSALLPAPCWKTPRGCDACACCRRQTPV